METFYIVIFGLQALIAAALEYGNRIGSDNKHTGASTDFLLFRNNYLVVYSLMMGASAVYTESSWLYHDAVNLQGGA